MIRSKISLRITIAFLGCLAVPVPAPGQAPDVVDKTSRTDAVVELLPFGVTNGEHPVTAGWRAFDTWTPSFDVLQATFGLQLAPADEALRSQLEIPAGQGVVVVGVRPGGLAEHAGLKTNDVILGLGDQKVGDVNQARGVLLGIGKQVLEVKLIREGKSNRMSLVGPEHGFPPESAEYWIGVPVSPVDVTLRSHLATLPAETGLIVNDVVPKSPAEAAGVKKNDILLVMGGRPLKTPGALIEQIQASGGKPVPMEVIRAGKSISITITPARRVHPTVINQNNRIVEYHLIRPHLAGEVGSNQFFDFLSTPPRRPGPDGGKSDRRPVVIPFELRSNRPNTGDERVNDRIEARLKELSDKLDAIGRSVEKLGNREAK